MNALRRALRHIQEYKGKCYKPSKSENSCCRVKRKGGEGKSAKFLFSIHKWLYKSLIQSSKHYLKLITGKSQFGLYMSSWAICPSFLDLMEVQHTCLQSSISGFPKLQVTRSPEQFTNILQQHSPNQKTSLRTKKLTYICQCYQCNLHWSITVLYYSNTCHEQKIKHGKAWTILDSLRSGDGKGTSWSSISHTKEIA